MGTISNRWKLLRLDEEGSVLAVVVVGMLLIVLVGSTFLSVSISRAKITMSMIDTNIKYYRDEGVKAVFAAEVVEPAYIFSEGGEEWAEEFSFQLEVFAEDGEDIWNEFGLTYDDAWFEEDGSKAILSLKDIDSGEVLPPYEYII